MDVVAATEAPSKRKWACPLTEKAGVTLIVVGNWIYALPEVVDEATNIP